ncbi:hypothetical protein ACKKBG_A23110 [Auxenochlorella protothecoides x Auxenochlorella symbiontica]
MTRRRKNTPKSTITPEQWDRFFQRCEVIRQQHLEKLAAADALKNAGAAAKGEDYDSYNGSAVPHPHPRWASPAGDDKIKASPGLPPPTDRMEEDTEMDDAIRAKLTQTMKNPAMWSVMNDTFMEAIIALCMKDQTWKKTFGQKLCEERLTTGEVLHQSSPSPAAHQPPALRAHSGLALNFTSEAENMYGLSDPTPAGGHLAMPKPQHSAQQPPAPHHHPMACVPSLVSHATEAPAGVLTRSDIQKFNEMEIQ